MSNLKELIEELIEIDESEEKNEERLHELDHEIDHKVFESEFLIPLIETENDETEIITLIIGEEDDDSEEYLIPIYTDEEEFDEGIKQFIDGFDETKLLRNKLTGEQLITAYCEDEEFVGVIINAPQCGFIIPMENIHQCC